MMNSLMVAATSLLGMPDAANHPVKALEKTVGIIHELTARRSAKLHELASALELNKSTVHNHLSTLREHEFVVKDGDEYRLSFEFLHVGGVLRNDIELYTKGKEPVETLAADTGTLVTLATHERGRAVVLYRAKGEQAVEIDTHVGSQITLHNSALGKAILAHLPEDRVDDIIDTHGLPASTPNTITDRETLDEELAQIRADGFAFDDEEQWRGLRCLGAPILTDDGEVKGGISLSAPKNDITDDPADHEYVSAVKSTANILELALSYA